MRERVLQNDVSKNLPNKYYSLPFDCELSLNRTDVNKILLSESSTPQMTIDCNVGAQKR